MIGTGTSAIIKSLILWYLRVGIQCNVTKSKNIWSASKFVFKGKHAMKWYRNHLTVTNSSKNGLLVTSAGVIW